MNKYKFNVWVSRVLDGEDKITVMNELFDNTENGNYMKKLCMAYPL